MVNVYEQVDRNKTRSLIVMALFIVFVTFVVWIFSQAFGYGLGTTGLALIVAGLFSFTSYWYSDKIILAISGARLADKSKDFNFYTVCENLAMASQLPMPKLYVIEDTAPNAFATGRDPDHAVICATTGLLQKLDRTELEGVVAHELSHIGNYDIRLMSIVTILIGMVTLMADWFLHGLRFRSNDDRGSGQLQVLMLVLGLVLAILSPIIGQLIQLAISRRREFLADASASLLTRYPEGLARALEKIALDPEPLEVANKATAHLYIISPFKGKQAKGWLMGLFNTHPPVEERIKALRGMV
jgi:heat shock protein HtpX